MRTILSVAIAAAVVALGSGVALAQAPAKAGDSAANLCEAYFHVGMHRLGEGKRAEAKRCFEKARDTCVYTFGEYMWSRAFLGCIDDPQWLPWLSERK